VASAYIDYVPASGASGVLTRVTITPHSDATNSTKLVEEFSIWGRTQAGAWEVIGYYQGNRTATAFDVNVDSTKAYTGFRLLANDSIADPATSSAQQSIGELTYWVKDARVLPSLAQIQDMGIRGIDASNIEQFNVRLAKVGQVTAGTSALQVVADDMLVAQAEIASSYLHEQPTQDLSLFERAGYKDVTSTNVLAVQTQIAKAHIGATPSSADVQDAIDTVNHNFKALSEFMKATAFQGFSTLLASANEYVLGDLSSTSAEAAGLVSASHYYDQNWTALEAFDSSATTGYASSYALSSTNPGLVGIYDALSHFGPRVLENVQVRVRGAGEIPSSYDIQGYNATTHAWENVHTVTNGSTAAGLQTINVDSSKAYSGFRLYFPQSASDKLVVLYDVAFNVKASNIFASAGIDGVDDKSVVALSQYFGNLTPQQQTTAMANPDNLRAMVADFERQGMTVFEGLSTDSTAAKSALGVTFNQAYVPLNGAGGTILTDSRYDTTTHDRSNLFDQKSTTNWANAHVTSANNLSWAGWTSNNSDNLAVLKGVTFDPRDNFANRVPSTWWVEGYNGATWTKINGTDRTENAADWTTTTPRTISFAGLQGSYSGFRVVASDTFSTDPGSDFNLDELQFVVDRVSMSPYIAAGLDDFEKILLDRVNTVVAAERAHQDNGLTRQEVVNAIDSVELEANVMKLAPGSDFDTASEIATLRDAIADYRHVVQGEDAAALSVDDINLIAGRTIATADNLDELRQEIAGSNSVLTAQSTFLNMLATDAYVDYLIYEDGIGTSKQYTADDQSTAFALFDAHIAFDDGVSLGDTVELLVDGQTVFSHEVNVTSKTDHGFFVSNLDPFNLDINDDNNLVIVVQHVNAQGAIDETAPWEVRFG
jgi:hypothetical protein